MKVEETIVFVPMLKSYADKKGYGYSSAEQMIKYEVAQAQKKKTNE